MQVREFNRRLVKMTAHAATAFAPLMPAFSGLFEALRTELNGTAGTPAWKDDVASAAGVSLCDLAERLASDLKA